MARKRLNKKVAIIGSAAFVLVALFAVLVILRLSRDPDKFIQDADAAWASKDYQAAQRNYVKALNLVRDNDQKVVLLFKIADACMRIDEWRKALGCWEQIVTIDPANVKARLGRLQYRYEVADSLASFHQGVSGHWKELKSQATEMLDVVEKAGLLQDDVSKWEAYPSSLAEPNTIRYRLMGPYLYLMRGRASYELASLGAVTDPDELLREATDDFEKLLKLEPNNVDAYRYLANAAVARGELFASRGKVKERDEAAKQAVGIFEQAVKAAPDNPAAHINLLSKKLELARHDDIAIALPRIAALEPDYTRLVGRFADSAEAFSSLAEFYGYYSLNSGPKDSEKRLDDAIKAAERAVELGKTAAAYSLTAASLHYRKFSVYKHAPAMSRAVELAENALKFPQAQETSGPRHYEHLMHRFSLLCFLANSYVEQILDSDKAADDAQKKAWLTKAEQAVHEIEQIQGSGENPQVIKWQGLLELAKGNTTLAVRKLYAAHDQFKATSAPGQGDAVVAYTLARIFKDSPEVGAVAEFLAGAINSGIANVKPESYLDYAQVMLRFSLPDVALSAADSFEQRYGSNRRSNSLRIAALTAKGHITEAEEAIAKLDPESADAIKLRLGLLDAKNRQLHDAIRRAQPQDDSAIVVRSVKPADKGVQSGASLAAMTSELNSNRRIESELLCKLLPKEPAAVSDTRVASLCESLIASGQIKPAQDLVGGYLQQFPQNTVSLYYKHLLSEPQPGSATAERRQQIQEQTIGEVADPIRRSLEFGLYYRRYNQPEKAIPELKKVLDAAAPQAVKESQYAYTDQMSPQYIAAAHLFDAAREAKNWELADEVVKIAQKRNLDDCQGELFAARLALARSDHKAALTRLDECIRQKPVFAQAYVLRGNVHTILGNEQSAMSDVRKAVSLNPTDATAAKALANALYVRNRKLGENVTKEQKLETKEALVRAIQLDPLDIVLLGAYADFISSDEPLQAMALRQVLQKRTPSLKNAVELGKLATGVALGETDKVRKDAFFGIAQSAFEQALKIDRTDVTALDGYAEYYRARGQYDQAQKLLTESKDERLLWRHYFRIGRMEEAKKVLDRLYQQNSKDSDTLKGLIVMAESSGDAEAVQKHSDALISVEDNAENRVGQVRTLLNVGLVAEAERKLQSLKEKHPKEPASLLLEAWLAMRQGQLQTAVELINKNIEANQDDAYAWRLRGEICLLTAGYDQAISDLKKSKSLSDAAATRVSLARAYLRAGRDDDAVTELKSMLDRPDATEEARTLLEEVYFRSGRKEPLRQLYEDTMRKFPENVHWRSRAAAFAIDLGEFDRAEQLYRQSYDAKLKQYAGQPLDQAVRDIEYSTALDGYLRAIVLGAGDPNSTGKVGWHPEKLDKVFEEAAKYLDTVYAPVAFYRMAEAKLALGDKAAVTDYCRKAVDRAWQNELLAVEVLLRVFLLLGPDEVTRYCQERLTTSPNSLAANFAMFNLAKIKGDYDEAVKYVTKCASLVGPDSSQGLDYEMKRAQLLTIAYQKTSDNRYLERAVTDYESLLVKMPSSTSVLNNLAYMLAQSNDKLPKALEHAKRALEFKPNDANFLDTYAYVLHRMGRNSEAAAALAAAIQQYAFAGGPPPEAYEHLGMVKEALGDKTQAVAAYKRALEIGSANLSDVATARIKSAIGRLTQ